MSIMLWRVWSKQSKWGKCHLERKHQVQVINEHTGTVSGSVWCMFCLIDLLMIEITENQMFVMFVWSFFFHSQSENYIKQVYLTSHNERLIYCLSEYYTWLLIRQGWAKSKSKISLLHESLSSPCQHLIMVMLHHLLLLPLMCYPSLRL